MGRIPLGLLGLILLNSCLGNQTAREKRESLGAQSEDPPQVEKDTLAPPLSDEAIYWDYRKTSSVGPLLLGESSKTVAYLRGTAVNEYLKRQNELKKNDQVYCVVFSFSDPRAYGQYRARAIPLSHNEYSEGRGEYLLRVDFNRSSTVCRGQTRLGPGENTSPSFTLGLEDICPSCDSVTSKTIHLYAVSSNNTILPTGLVEEIQTALLKLELKVIMGTEDQPTGAQCSETACGARGYDCCLDGQCVRDGQMRPGVASRAANDPTGFGAYYEEALRLTAQTPSLFSSYGDIYFVCPQSSIDGLSSILEVEIEEARGESPAQAHERFEREKEEYFCLEGAKDGEDYSGCRDENGDGEVNREDWEIVKKRVSKRYGCALTNPTVPYCPDYGLKAQRNAQGVITAILSDIPDPLQIERPLQRLDIELSSKTVPHRFFRSDTGEGVNDISLLEEGIQSEGTPFYYLHGEEKIGPVSGSFNMNAILGQMEITLTGAHPARAVSVEFDRDYILMAREGIHNPCPLCPRDSWFESLTAFPSTSRGMGLQATGFTTRRDNFSGNRSRGNYEDTLFGRACWVPPTMIPSTHRPTEEGAQDQRLRRLRAQAALFVNGYRRDWYGFNLGALIGSFDGIQWFAIGTGRKVTATSDTLYLAINAPFGDLTEPTLFSVSILTDLHPNQAPSVDYDHNLSSDDPRQNQAATCRHHHLCDNDIDCVTQLGHEYVCADISHYRSSWPSLDAKAVEIGGREKARVDFSDIIFGDYFSSPRGTKRCVYRGSGALCSRSIDSLSSLEKKRLLSCAPNFYCAELGSLSFNNQPAREAEEVISTILYGQERNVLGRPLHYIGATGELTSEIVENLTYNASEAVYDGDGNEFEKSVGLCLPGKDVSPETTNWIAQQTTPDALKRTDYISQIGSCDSSSFNTATQSRVQSCPTFIMDPEDENFGNYTHFEVPDPFNGSGVYGIKQYEMQNACGGEATVDESNLFATIEALTLGNLFTIEQPTLVKDACFKRASSPCFTDLDCIPGRPHAEQASHLNEDAFGGSKAEYEYWREYLVCSQEKVNKKEAHNRNRCCREIGKDFTMYSRIENATDDLMDYLQLENNSVEQNPMVERHPGEEDAPGYDGSTVGKYSRYTIVDMLTTADTDANTGYYSDSDRPRSPIVSLADDENPAAYQWQTFEETGRKTCCGGQWIRKFADSSSDWLKFKRLYLNYESFSCLNHISPLSFAKPDHVAEINWEKEASNLCLSPSAHGCIETGIYRAQTYEIQSPRDLEQTSFSAWQELLNGSNEEHGELFTDTLMNFSSCNGTGDLCAYIDTTPSDGDCTGADIFNRQYLNPFAPYHPLVLEAQQIGGSGDPFLSTCVIQSLGNASDPVQYTMSLPVYVGGYENIRAIQFKFFDDEGNGLNAGDGDVLCERPLDDCGTIILKGGSDDLTGQTDCNTGDPADAYPFASHFSPADNDSNEHGAWCVHVDDKGRQVLKVAFNKGATFDTDLWQHASIRIEFNPIGTSAWDGTTGEQQAMLPGNDNYYLTKLARLELLGIPQIFYEPLYCNHDKDKLIPDFYTEDLYNSTGDDDRLQVEGNTEVFEYSLDRYGTNRRLENIYDSEFDQTDDSKTGDGLIMYADKINHEAIFSAHEFKCCRGLGQTAHGPSECCSGFAKLREDVTQEEGQPSAGQYICRLPNGTNLNVYFNRFVSNEGQGENGGLTDDDFIPETGEVKLERSAYQKLRNLGRNHCDTQETVRGGAFGFFAPSLTILGDKPDEGGHPAEDLRYSIADEASDLDEGQTGGGNSNDSGAAYFESGLHWDHHIYCAPGGG